MLGVVVPHGLDVDRHHLADAQQVAHRREEERAAAAIRPRLDDELRPSLRHDLLIHPEVERVLERLRPEPGRLRPRVGLVEHVVGAGDGRAVEATIDAETDCGQPSADVVLHGAGF